MNFDTSFDNFCDYSFPNYRSEKRSTRIANIVLDNFELSNFPIIIKLFCEENIRRLSICPNTKYMFSKNILNLEIEKKDICYFGGNCIKGYHVDKGDVELNIPIISKTKSLSDTSIFSNREFLIKKFQNKKMNISEFVREMFGRNIRKYFRLRQFDFRKDFVNEGLVITPDNIKEEWAIRLQQQKNNTAKERIDYNKWKKNVTKTITKRLKDNKFFKYSVKKFVRCARAKIEKRMFLLNRIPNLIKAINDNFEKNEDDSFLSKVKNKVKFRIKKRNEQYFRIKNDRKNKKISKRIYDDDGSGRYARTFSGKITKVKFIDLNIRNKNSEYVKIFCDILKSSKIEISTNRIEKFPKVHQKKTYDVDCNYFLRSEKDLLINSIVQFLKSYRFIEDQLSKSKGKTEKKIQNINKTFEEHFVRLKDSINIIKKYIDESEKFRDDYYSNYKDMDNYVNSKDSNNLSFISTKRKNKRFRKKKNMVENLKVEKLPQNNINYRLVLDVLSLPKSKGKEIVITGLLKEQANELHAKVKKGSRSSKKFNNDGSWKVSLFSNGDNSYNQEEILESNFNSLFPNLRLNKIK